MAPRITCLVGRHRWSSTENYQTQGYDFRCERCGKERHTYPGDPGFRPTRRPDTHGGAGEVGGGGDGGWG